MYQVIYGAIEHNLFLGKYLLRDKRILLVVYVFTCSTNFYLLEDHFNGIGSFNLYFIQAYNLHQFSYALAYLRIVAQD